MNLTCDHGRKRVVVTKANFVSRNRVIFIDHRNHAPINQVLQGIT